MVVVGPVGGCLLVCFGLCSLALRVSSLVSASVCFGWLAGACVFVLSCPCTARFSVWLGAALCDFCGSLGFSLRILFETGNLQHFMCSDVSFGFALLCFPVRCFRCVCFSCFMFLFSDVSFWILFLFLVFVVGFSCFPMVIH